MHLLVVAEADCGEDEQIRALSAHAVVDTAGTAPAGLRRMSNKQTMETADKNEKADTDLETLQAVTLVASELESALLYDLSLVDRGHHLNISNMASQIWRSTRKMKQTTLASISRRKACQI
jgi:hypothetical protein